MPGVVVVVNSSGPAGSWPLAGLFGLAWLSSRLPSRASTRTWLPCSWNGCCQRPVPMIRSSTSSPGCMCGLPLYGWCGYCGA
ncbi:MYXO-CTERM sorting domain-containing protein [Burkholderia ubonensis]|uniref:MYXO-CTERM sorting domain-containing protein n=1 Tax=Burkholderia ubonensis TaxID=101571 RepID=UPI00358F93BF